MRTAFSTVVRESQDLACGVFDRAAHDRPVADRHARPHQRDGHRHAPLPGRLPAGDARAGRRADHQRPVETAGQINDITVVTPVFRGGRVVAYFANTCHSPDIGGRVLSAEAREVYEEGLRIPIMKLFARGEPNETLLRDHPRQRAHARRDDRRPVRADRRATTSARASLLRVHGRVRPARLSRRCRTRSSGAPSGRCARRSRALPDGDVHERGVERRLRRADPCIMVDA